MPELHDERLRGPHGLLLGPDDYPLAAPVSHLAPKGVLDGFIPPNHFFGWVRIPDAKGLEPNIVIRIGSEIVGSGKPTKDRPDVLNAPQPAGFAIRAFRAIGHEEIASGALSVEASAGPHKGPVHIPAYVATRSFDFVSLSYLARADGWDRNDVSALIGFAEAEAFSPAAKRKLLAMLAVLNKGSRSRRVEELAASAVEGLKESAVIGAAASTQPLSDGEVVARFESLGENCELGFVQKHFHRDPDSLLRWSSTPYDLLIKGLQNRFAGVGDPTYTTLIPFGGDGGYATRDTRYDLTSHTQVRDIPSNRYDAEFASHCKRLAWLRGAFFESLQDSSKIYVRFDYKSLTAPQAHVLFGELNKYGHNRLLIVRADRERDGAVEMLRPDLCVGYIRGFSRSEAIDKYAQYDSWIGMLRNALNFFGR